MLDWPPPGPKLCLTPSLPPPDGQRHGNCSCKRSSSNIPQTRATTTAYVDAPNADDDSIADRRYASAAEGLSPRRCRAPTRSTPATNPDRSPQRTASTSGRSSTPPKFRTRTACGLVRSYKWLTRDLLSDQETTGMRLSTRAPQRADRKWTCRGGLRRRGSLGLNARSRASSPGEKAPQRFRLPDLRLSAAAKGLLK
jgi:hypothetical protein